MAIVGIAVRWDGQDYSCIAVPDARLGVKFKCGKCGRGVVPPFTGEKCLLCGAVVSIVDDRKTRGDWGKNGFYGTATMRGESFRDEFNIPPKPKPLMNIEAIRARHEERLKTSAIAVTIHEPTAQVCADIDALLRHITNLDAELQ